MIRAFFLFLLSLVSAEILASSLAETYINRYKHIAIAEMERTGIPASIKLAQGLLESDWGRSDLAVQANNHFGIKCGSAWDGDTFYKMDDERDPSCFRVFNSPEASYFAHSEFLTSENKGGRYEFLFDYDRTDYASWAKGLKKAGYATDRHYPKKLIEIIEKYELYKFDSTNSPMLALDDGPDPDPTSPATEVNTSRSRLKITNQTSSRDYNSYTINDYTFSRINDVRYTRAIGGETLESLAAKTGTSVEKLMSYNEGYGYGSVILNTGDIIFLSKKKRSYSGAEEFHLVRDGETMFDISQKYGIKLVNLYAKNKMPRGSEPLPGEKVFLQRTPDKSERPSYVKNPNTDREVEILFADDPSVK